MGSSTPVPTTVTVEQVQSPAFRVDDTGTSTEQANREPGLQTTDTHTQPATTSSSMHLGSEALRSELGMLLPSMLDRYDVGERQQVLTELEELREYFGSFEHRFPVSRRSIGTSTSADTGQSSRTVPPPLRRSDGVVNVTTVKDAIIQTYILGNTLQSERIAYGVDGTWYPIVGPTRKDQIIGVELARTVNRLHHFLRDPDHVQPLVSAINQVINTGGTPTLKPVLPYVASVTIRPVERDNPVVPTTVLVDSGADYSSQPRHLSVGSPSIVHQLALRRVSDVPTVVDMWGEQYVEYSYHARIQLDGLDEITGVIQAMSDEMSATQSSPPTVSLAQNALIAHYPIGSQRGISVQRKPPKFTSGRSMTASTHSENVSVNNTENDSLDDVARSVPQAVEYSHLPGDRQYVPVEISPTNWNGQPLNIELLVDTGADNVVLNHGLANEAGITAIDHGSVHWDSIGRIDQCLQKIVKVKRGSAQSNTSITRTELVSELSILRSAERYNQSILQHILNLSQQESSRLITLYQHAFERIASAPSTAILDQYEQILNEGGKMTKGNNKFAPMYPITVVLTGQVFNDTVVLTEDEVTQGAIGKTILKHFLVGPGNRSLVF